MIYVDKKIKSFGGNLSAGFVVAMPHNAIGSRAFSKAQHEIMFRNWKARQNFICEFILSRKNGVLETSNLFIKIISSGLLLKLIPILFRFLTLVIIKGFKSLEFISNEKCNGCKTCKEICSVNNIEMIDNKPSWSKHCEGCLACFHWCPKEAIKFGSNGDLGVERYHHPEVKIANMITHN
jgi:ferredoxin